VLCCERRALSQKRVVFGMGEIVPKTEVFGTHPYHNLPTFFSFLRYLL